MNRRVVVALGALLASTCLATGATAASGPTAKPGEILITATGSTHGTLTITHNTDLWLEAVVTNWALALPRGTLTTLSPYVGMQISRGHHVIFGFYVDRDLPDVQMIGDYEPTLGPGQYEVTVLSARPAVIHIPIRGSDRHTVRLTQPRAATRTEVNPDSIAPGQPVNFATISTRVTTSSTELLLFASTATAENAHNADLCLTTKQLPCAAGSVSPATTSTRGYGLGATGEVLSQSALTLVPRTVPAGTFYAAADRQAVGVEHTATFIVVTMET